MVKANSPFACRRTPLFPDKIIYSVSRFTSIVRTLLEDNFPHVWVEGEISNLSTPSSGHCYFTLKDAGAQLRCVMFRSSVRNLRFRLQDGLGLIVMGRVSLYEQRGEYQLVVDYAEPLGVGALQMAFVQLKEKLAAEGLFDGERKKPLPLFPRAIGIVTSLRGAALHDMLQILERRFSNLELLIAPVKVQGEGAAGEIAAAVDDFNRYGKVDVLIVGRGGGSLEDLWAFNEEKVARAIARSRIPVISAVGHEVDFTIADFVADLRAPTPSAAAELVIRSKSELCAQVDALSHRLVRGMHHFLDVCHGDLHGSLCRLKHPSVLLENRAQRVDDLRRRLSLSLRHAVEATRGRVSFSQRRLALLNPALQAERCRERLAALQYRLAAAVHGRVESVREETMVAAARLQALSPLQTLSRGYCLARTMPRGKPVRSAAELRPGDRLSLVFSRGSAECTVDRNEPRED